MKTRPLALAIENQAGRDICLGCDRPVPYRDGVLTGDGQVICDACFAWIKRNRERVGKATGPDDAALEIAANR